jgi:hypothetical protein
LSYGLGRSDARWSQLFVGQTGIKIGDGTNGPTITASGTSPNESLNLNPSPAGTGIITAGSPLAFNQVATPASSPANSAQIYSKDVSGTAEMFVMDEAGNEQPLALVLTNTTTDATPTRVFLNGSSTNLNVTAGTMMTGMISVVGTRNDGSACAYFVRKFAIKNVAGTTSIVGSVETIGTDQEDAATDLSIAADDTNDALAITVTGVAAQTWKWRAVIDHINIITF